MAETERLISELTAELRPVRRLRHPVLRAGLWLALAAAIGLGLGAVFGGPHAVAAVLRRLLGAPDMWGAATGALLTAILAAIAAFETSVPGRSPRWALLPLPAAVLWLGSSTAGCLRAWPLPGAVPEPPMEPMACLKMLLLLAVPLSVLMILLLRRAYPVRPGLTALLAGLASAGAAASLLNLIHPYDATAGDLLVHLAAVAAIVAVNRALGGGLLSPHMRRREKSDADTAND